MEENGADVRLIGMQAAVMRHREIDLHCIEACKHGDRAAFQALYEACKDSVYSIAFHFSGDDATAKDITQHVFLKLFTSIAQFRHEADFSTWLYRIVANACLDQRRSHRRFEQLSPAIEGSAMTAEESQEKTCARREVAESVQAAIGELTPKLRLPILLRYVEELSYDDIASALGCSKGTVASRLNRGHKLLARKLAHLRDELASGG